VHTGTSITDGTTEMADVDWPAAISALDAGALPCSGGEQRMLRLAASLAAGTPVNLRDTLTGIDQRNTQLLITAILHATGQRPSSDIP
jgi:ABC-type cobalamin/Fe3+-siderophores transport system ATPase subunit